MKRHRVHKTYQEINEKIKQGKAVVVTAEEMIDVVASEVMPRVNGQPVAA